MHSFLGRAKVLGTIAAISAVVIGGGCAGDGAADSPSPSSVAPLVTPLRAPLPVPPQNPSGNPWRLIGGGDFNFDFVSDVVWNNTVDNRISVWLMNGSQVLCKGPDIAGPPGDGWVVATALDMNFDAMADVLWYNAKATSIAVWLMNGTELLAAGPPIAGPGDGWNLTGVGDFNSDGRRDVLWYNADKDLMVIWFMDGNQLLSRGPLIPGRTGP